MKLFTLAIIGVISYICIYPVQLKTNIKNIITNFGECDTLNCSNSKKDSIVNSILENKKVIGLSTALSINNCTPWIATGGF